jgi:hypothetical protein
VETSQPYNQVSVGQVRASQHWQEHEMTDRELLELAAKAVGGTLSEGHTQRRTGPTWDTWEWIGGLGINMPDGRVAYPLTDDGDALRLAVRLKIPLRFEENKIDCCDRTIAGKAAESWSDTEGENADPYAATRRAIVRAAAEIGRAMK